MEYYLWMTVGYLVEVILLKLVKENRGYKINQMIPMPIKLHALRWMVMAHVMLSIMHMSFLQVAVTPLVIK
jgi:hypothetical protein